MLTPSAASRRQNFNNKKKSQQLTLRCLLTQVRTKPKEPVKTGRLPSPLPWSSMRCYTTTRFPSVGWEGACPSRVLRRLTRGLALELCSPSMPARYNSWACLRWHGEFSRCQLLVIPPCSGIYLYTQWRCTTPCTYDFENISWLSEGLEWLPATATGQE